MTSANCYRLQTIYDPNTGLPFPGNVIPSDRLDPISLKLLNYYKSGTLPGKLAQQLCAEQSFPILLIATDLF